MSRSAINKRRYELLAHDTYSSEIIELSLLANFPGTVKHPYFKVSKSSNRLRVLRNSDGHAPTPDDDEIVPDSPPRAPRPARAYASKYKFLTALFTTVRYDTFQHQYV